MGHLVKFVSEVSTHALGGRSRIVELGVGRFKDCQFFQQRIELSVRNCWFREHIIPMVVRVEFVA